MVNRWLTFTNKGVPKVDLDDIKREVCQDEPTKRQFAPEYSQTVYAAMLEQEIAIGDYTTSPDSQSESEISCFER